MFVGIPIASKYTYMYNFIVCTLVSVSGIQSIYFVAINRLDWSWVLPQTVGLGLGTTQATMECGYSTGVWICNS